jgi:hypothetical protein
MRSSVLSRLDVGYRPTSVVLQIPSLVEGAPTAERELRSHAQSDCDKCCGYFPALTGTAGIVSDLPACRALAAQVPGISHGGSVYHFNFLRLSLVQQSCEPEFHLDTDAATALTGDSETLCRRRVLRMVLNLSTTNQRALHYLDVDSSSVQLVVRGGHVTVAASESLCERVLVAVVPPRRGPSVHGLVFASNRVLHSGVDAELGHFIAAYGVETAETGVAPYVDSA